MGMLRNDPFLRRGDATATSVSRDVSISTHKNAQVRLRY